MQVKTRSSETLRFGFYRNLLILVFRRPCLFNQRVLGITQVAWALPTKSII
ncbi:hypothetical protein NEIMUCOT_05359 [Neisseria mucosa ATCC 25996]|uniref:Uncharacterized protein n=1 Tax=Neisseria mucosa (strain ATCC 25996 / DSM 4631 / NCTC 10774 / M26) TaxID=546266 RepID=D2ZXK5_NEIM2|nr:hypothetical protein NEIMUCOT_05359 [Neisseria mucosa ATCC 25996]